ncbi:S-adenosylmethionine-binding domain-containing protein [Microbacterium sp. LRZ72]|uniref:MT-A70 family methyltransferase n=1 Tax=Microbacterium sp. LRZ72 TaxID=2942481 RepID=UPI0029BD4BE0|nr:MT-A70 family methyltransferase [Microbacterium sp. LRZ72]MDX2375635.1 S-adenosylmethionine-binding domain-containing protein [Microbacterium sp. LRZ72]
MFNPPQLPNELPARTDAPEAFDVIYADPPWDLQQKGARGAGKHYDLLSLEEVKGLGDAVRALGAPNSHLYLWVTNATLRDGYDVMEAWGYTVRSPLTWIKPRFTLGNYLRNATEHLLFGTRGTAPVKYRSQPTWMFAPLLDHSVKPDEAYAVIDRVSGRDATKLELFARRRPPAPNWWVWGNEIESDASLLKWGYPVPSDFARQDETHTGEVIQEVEG